jgi:RNA polymerase sigma-70 factor, ECF subfamily
VAPDARASLLLSRFRFLVPALTAAAARPSNLLIVNEADAAILTRAKSGNREAFRTIVERHSAGVFRVAYRLTRSEQDAEDVVQETFLKAYAELRRFEGRAALGTWLHRIAANCAIDLIRRRPAVAGEPVDAEPAIMRVASASPGPDRQAAGREMREHVEAALADLTPLERAAFTLRHLEEQSIEEICRVLGQSPSATRHSIFRAVAKMRRTLAPLVGVQP